MRGRRSWFIPNNPDAYLASNEAQPPPPARWQPREWLAPGYLRRGYGNVKKWPFSKEKAYLEPGYQRGVRRAINSPVYAQPWRQAARKRLREVEEMEEADAKRRIAEAELDAQAQQDEADAYLAPLEDDIAEQDLIEEEALGRVQRIRANRQGIGAVQDYFGQTGTHYSGVGKRKHRW